MHRPLIIIYLFSFEGKFIVAVNNLVSAQAGHANDAVRECEALRINGMDNTCITKTIYF